MACLPMSITSTAMRKLLALISAAMLSSTAIAREKDTALYVLTKPQATASQLPCWAQHYPKFDTIVGYSVLGHFFLRSKADNEYIVLHPFKRAAKSYGVFASPAEFEEKILKEPGFQEYVLRPDHVSEVRKHVGALKRDQVYIPKPYPFVGGTDAPSSYDKGDVWVFMDIVGQMQGLC